MSALHLESWIRRAIAQALLTADRFTSAKFSGVRLGCNNGLFTPRICTLSPAMPKKPTADYLTPKDVAPHAYKWNREQMEEMKAIIDGLLATAAESTDNPPQEGEAPGGKSPQRRKLAGGSIEEKTINGCGPYRYLRYRHEGKYKSVYVGKLEAG